MNTCLVNGLASMLALALLSTGNFATAQDLPSLDVMAGKALFEKNWVSAPASTAASDGLGPFFNARSCAGCHEDGGRGALPEALNFVTADPVYGEFLQTHAVQGLRAEAQVEISIHEQTRLLEDGTEVVLHAPYYELNDLQYGTLAKPLSARIAPSLMGLHLLEQVPEQYLQSQADPDDSNGDGISGRISKVPELATGALVTGRFGWKAESYSLRMQVARALSLDMGLGSALFPSSFGDCTPRQPDCLRMAPGNSPAMTDPEVSATILDLLLLYLSSLDPAEQQAQTADITVPEERGTTIENGRDVASPAYVEHILAKNSDARERAIPSGQDLFSSIGCGACHSSSLPAGDTLIRPFTDLLLHDMGPGLAVEANEFTAGAEWRTAPLWGLSSARFYLHDGRATTLEEAILWHEGEAIEAVKAYSRLPKYEREVLHTWLHGL